MVGLVDHHLSKTNATGGRLLSPGGELQAFEKEPPSKAFTVCEKLQFSRNLAATER
jgi:hypothetical protein